MNDNNETPEEIARRERLPLIPRLPDLPLAAPGVVCGECGMIWRGVMNYSCANARCPVQPKVT